MAAKIQAEKERKEQLEEEKKSRKRDRDRKKLEEDVENREILKDLIMHAHGDSNFNWRNSNHKVLTAAFKSLPRDDDDEDPDVPHLKQHTKPWLIAMLESPMERAHK
mmetsp:Transcript_6789/g.11211  ORF Transcript_6789/g.11211 Transcript_6789/m.11211 type:complete len:107 (-) Transcript_6789:443-763(-)